MDSVQNLLKEVNAKIKALDTAKQLYGEQLAPNFLVFDFVNTNETGLSWILACLLDPKGSHGQKTLFLENFIKICLPNIQHHKKKLWQNYLNSLSDITVKTEDTTTASQSYRRMDIYLSAKINDETFGICIENKPYANDQPDQLTDYFKELEKRNLTHKHIVYLSEYGEPSENSVKADTLKIWHDEQVFSHVPYTKLVDWLTECKKDCQNHSVTEFLNQFIKFIQKQFMGVEDMNQENTVIESIMGNSTSLAAAMRVYNAIPDVQAKLIEKLTEQLKQKFNEKSYLPTVTKMGSHRYAGFDIDCSSYGIEISFEFQKANYNELCMGYRMMDKQYQKGGPKFNELAEKVRLSLPNKNMKTSDTWLGWYIPTFGYWQKDIEIWQKIEDGTLANEIMDEVELLYNNVIDKQIKVN